MGTGREFPMKVGLAGKLVETTRIRTDGEQLERNRKAGKDLAATIKASGLAAELLSRGALFSRVPVDVVRDFLRVFRADAADPLTDPRLISDYIDARADGELTEWDVLFASAQKADATESDLAGIGMRAFTRSVGEADLRQGVLSISGASRRVGSPGDERAGLSAEQIEAATQAFRKACSDNSKEVPKTLPPRIFCEVKGRRPLIILRFVAPTVSDEALNGELPGMVLAWSIVFPPSDVQNGTVEYIVNTIRMREMFGEEEVEEEALGDTE
jgi:hypothetical protein